MLETIVVTGSRGYRHSGGRVGRSGKGIFFLRCGRIATGHAAVGVKGCFGLVVFFDYFAFQLCALANGYLGVGFEGVFDALGL